MTTEGDLPATPRRRIEWSSLQWGPIGVAVAGVATVALTATLIYPLTKPASSDTRRPADGAAAEAKRSAGMAGLPGLPDPSGPSASASGSRGPSPGAPASGPATPATSAAGTRTVPRAGGKPVAGNTGVIAGTQLAVVAGDQTYATDNQVVQNADIRGYVRITGKKVTIRNSVVRGGTGGTARCGALIQIDAGASATIEDVEIAPSAPGACLDGVWATAVTLHRVNIHGTVNGVKAIGNDVVLQDSWVHDLSYFRDGAPGGGQTLNDAVESFGKRRVTLRHNALFPGRDANAAYQVTQEGGASGEIRVEGNWVDGGLCTLNFAHRGGGPTPMTGITVLNNRFGRNTKFVCPILISTQTTLAQNAGNVWDDTGAPIPAPDKHD